MKTHQISDHHLSIEKVEELLSQDVQLELSSLAKERIVRCREYLDEKMESTDFPIYGINTGFGSLCNTEISKSELNKLQENLVRSHACGVGDSVPTELVKVMLLLKIQGLSYGHSGVQLSTVQRLIDFYNNDVLPVIYEQGSLGASGDLAPLAQMSLTLIGEGEVHYKGKVQPARRVLSELGWEPIHLRSKEGLALLNGTQFMSAYGVCALIQSRRLLRIAAYTGAMSLDAYDGRIEPFSDLPHRVRKQPGQLKVARAIRELLEGSEIQQQPKVHVQDPYSFRCIPQVHGATEDVVSFVQSVFENEINSVTDNPTIFPDEDEIISAGNFHGQPLALALDQLAIALAELGSIAERRTFKLLNGSRGLPEFLVAKPGLNSGLMIPQYTAASIVSQNKQLCTPSSIDTIDSSNGQEDHVSMGANAATKCWRVVNNVGTVLAIEFMNACQAMEFRRPLKTGKKLEAVLVNYRNSIPFIKDDLYLGGVIRDTKAFVERMM